MSNEQKQNVIAKTQEEERATLDANLTHISSSPREEDERINQNSSTTDADTEKRKNELNKQSSLISQPQVGQFVLSVVLILSSFDQLRLNLFMPLI